MSLPVPIYLYPPYLAVRQAADVYNVMLGDRNKFSFGYVEQLSNDTYQRAVENSRVMYLEGETVGTFIISEVQYSVIKEECIILIEPPL